MVPSRTGQRARERVSKMSETKTGTEMKIIETNMHGETLVEYEYGPFSMRVVRRVDGSWFRGIVNSTEVVEIQPDYMNDSLRVKTWGTSEVDVDVLLKEATLAKEALEEFQKIVKDLSLKTS